MVRLSSAITAQQSNAIQGIFNRENIHPTIEQMMPQLRKLKLIDDQCLENWQSQNFNIYCIPVTSWKFFLAINNNEINIISIENEQAKSDIGLILHKIQSAFKPPVPILHTIKSFEWETVVQTKALTLCSQEYKDLILNVCSDIKFKKIDEKSDLWNLSLMNKLTFKQVPEFYDFDVGVQKMRDVLDNVFEFNKKYWQIESRIKKKMKHYWEELPMPSKNLKQMTIIIMKVFNKKIGHPTETKLRNNTVELYSKQHQLQIITNNKRTEVYDVGYNSCKGPIFTMLPEAIKNGKYKYSQVKKLAIKIFENKESEYEKVGNQYVCWIDRWKFTFAKNRHTVIKVHEEEKVNKISGTEYNVMYSHLNKSLSDAVKSLSIFPQPQTNIIPFQPNQFQQYQFVQPQQQCYLPQQQYNLTQQCLQQQQCQQQQQQYYQQYFQPQYNNNVTKH